MITCANCKEQIKMTPANALHICGGVRYLYIQKRNREGRGARERRLAKTTK